MIELGSKVKDSITTFEGVVTARSEHLSGNSQVCVESQSLYEGKPVIRWFDESRVSVVETG